MWQVLVCGAVIVSLAMGIRHGFGLWLQPLTQELGWGREDFATAIGIQNICWGLFGIFSGMLADRFGAFRVMVVSVLLYAAGLWGMAYATSPTWLALTAGVMVGAASMLLLSGLGFGWAFWLRLGRGTLGRSTGQLLRRDLLKVYPQLEEVGIDYAWSGLMSYARHQMPQIGQVDDGLWLAQAFGGHGVAQTAAGADAVAAGILGAKVRRQTPGLFFNPSGQTLRTAYPLNAGERHAVGLETG